MSDVYDDPQLAPEPPRDRWGRYLITPADGGKATGHTRMTTIAKALSDSFALTPWKLRTAGVGLTRRPDLWAMLQAADPTDRKAIDRIMADATEAGGASESANIGTAIHRFIEMVNLGMTVDAGEYQPTVDAYRAALDAHGMTVVPGMVERIVVLPDPIPIAGTFDMAVTVPGHELPCIADLKTGRSVDFGQTEWALQLAGYAHADTLWDPATDTHEPMLPVSRELAFIFHAPAGGDRCDVYALNIARGWEHFATALEVREWRKAKGLLVPATDVIGTVPTSNADSAVDDRVAHLIGRCKALAEHDPAGIIRLQGAWPDGFPTLRQHADGAARLTVAQLDQIDQLVTGAETVTEAPFTSDANPNMVPHNHPAIADLRDRTAALPSDLRVTVKGEFADQEIPKLSSGRATMAHLDAAERIVARAETVTARRTAHVEVALNAFPGSAVITMPADLTAAQLDKIDVLADAYDAGWLTEDLLVVDDIDAKIVDRFGGKRNALNAARPIAQDLGEQSPRAFADLVASRMLVAYLSVTDPVAD